ncbi:MAG: translation initiation factor [Candidatus Kapabacteria bacterium]|nr:translation initiation factor [Candidatus Kapabacteria bacterium]
MYRSVWTRCSLPSTTTLTPERRSRMRDHIRAYVKKTSRSWKSSMCTITATENTMVTSTMAGMTSHVRMAQTSYFRASFTHDFVHTMPGLEDLASLLGTGDTKPEPSKPKWHQGYDGNPMRIKVRIEKRRGKPVTIAQGFQSRPAELQRLLQMAKAKFGTGGQVTDNAFEINGDHVEKLKSMLDAERYLTR